MNFVPYLCCGDPSLSMTKSFVKAMEPYSAVIELGIPFSDPIADGKTIQEASIRSLNNGTNTDMVFGMVRELRSEGILIPFVFMAYYNTVYSYGRGRFIKKMKDFGVQGLIIPDLPFGEDREIEAVAKAGGISIIKLIAPNTVPERAGELIENEGMYTYLVSAYGTTGARSDVSEESLEFVRRMRKFAGNGKTLYVGFGISNAGQARRFAGAGADGVIVGSALIEIYSGRTLKGSSEGLKPEIDRMESLARSIHNI